MLAGLAPNYVCANNAAWRGVRLGSVMCDTVRGHVHPMQRLSPLWTRESYTCQAVRAGLLHVPPPANRRNRSGLAHSTTRLEVGEPITRDQALRHGGAYPVAWLVDAILLKRLTRDAGTAG